MKTDITELIKINDRYNIDINEIDNRIEDIKKILEDPATRFFVTETYLKAIDRDIVDSINDLKLVLKMLECRFNSIKGGK